MARLFNGTSDVITTPRVGSTLSTNFTIAAWVNCTDFAAERGIFQNGNTNVNGYGISIRQTTGKLSFARDGLSFNDSSFTMTAGVWTPVGLNNVPESPFKVNFYANGALVTPQGGVPALTAPATQCTIGRIETNMFFKGGIADVAIWNAVLTPQEMAQLARGARPFQIRPQNLAGCWLLDGYTDTTDLSNRANKGALTGTTFIPGPPLISAGPIQIISAMPKVTAASGAVFRRTLSDLGTRTGSRQRIAA